MICNKTIVFAGFVKCVTSVKANIQFLSKSFYTSSEYLRWCWWPSHAILVLLALWSKFYASLIEIGALFLHVDFSAGHMFILKTRLARLTIYALGGIDGHSVTGLDYKFQNKPLYFHKNMDIHHNSWHSMDNRPNKHQNRESIDACILFNAPNRRLRCTGHTTVPWLIRSYKQVLFGAYLDFRCNFGGIEHLLICNHFHSWLLRSLSDMKDYMPSCLRHCLQWKSLRRLI